MATRHLQKHFWLILCLPPCSEGGERRRGENRLLCTCRAPDHMQTPQSWTSRLLISALHSVCWREGKREEKRKKREEKEEDKTEEGKNKKERERARKREKERNKTPTHHTPPARNTPNNTTPSCTHTTHHTPQHLGQPTMILRVCECSDMCSPVNRPWSWGSFNVNAWICAQRATDRDLESVFVKRSECLDMCLSSNRPWSWDEKVNAWIRAKCLFLIKTVTSVTPVTSVILMRI